MATVAPWRMLIFKIQKSLSYLSVNQLQEVVSWIDDGSTTHDIDDVSEPELYDFIVDYLRSKKLSAMEDEDMSQLLLLNDLLSDLLPTDVGGREATAHEERCPTPPYPDHNHSDKPSTTPTTDIPTPPSQMNRDTHSLPAGDIPHGRVSMSSSSGDQVLRVNDVAGLLPRREFKLHGGQISDVGSDMSYSNLCKQIDEGMQGGFPESEVIHTVIKVIKPGTFREMLTNKSDLTVDELKRFLRAHIRDSFFFFLCFELFQELSNARQQDKESPQQFLYKIMGLKQRVLFESQQPGLNEKSSHVQQDFEPLLTDSQVTDDFLLDRITKSTIAKNRPVTVSSSQPDSSDSAKQTKVDIELQANCAAIRELTVQVSSLTKHLAQMVRPTDSTASEDLCSAAAHLKPPTSEARGRCSNCVQQSKKDVGKRVEVTGEGQPVIVKAKEAPARASHSKTASPVKANTPCQPLPRNRLAQLI
ncbi:hypothetical protein N1851_033780 [Merluccius polli]|uniref:Uncharacterized protein n=1 Tax=Merluccius polli TaxID=89951 RepID=A0AA47NNC4_MERPO|nr:hypothetical protein N1851_033780 [Merluccius polli]